MTDQPPAPGPEVPIPITPDMLDPAGPGGRVDFERGMRRAPPLTLTLIAALSAVFVWELATDALNDEAHIIAAGALARGPVAAGEVWRLLTATLLHGGWDHLIGNCIVLYIVGMACEHALGAARFALVYLASGLAGSCLSVVGGPGPSVGASGAIFGVVASVIVVFYRHRRRWHLRDRRIGFVLLAWAGYQIATGFLVPFIDNFAHLGGAAAGAAMTLAFGADLPLAPAARR